MVTKWHNNSYAGNIYDRIPNMKYDQGLYHIKYAIIFTKNKYNIKKHINTNIYITMFKWHNKYLTGDTYNKLTNTKHNQIVYSTKSTDVSMRI